MSPVIATVLPAASWVAELAKPVSAPTNVVAVMTPEEALMLPADKLPETLALPRTSSFAVGLLVPIPKFASEDEGIILMKVPSALISRKDASWDKSLLNAMVLVAGW